VGDARSSGGGDAAWAAMLAAIVAGDAAALAQLIAGTPALALAQAKQGATRHEAKAHFLDAIGHYVYAGDTALHVAAAAHRPALVRLLVDAGADVAARNRRGASALHYAVDGAPGSPAWDPAAQAACVTALLAAGADANAGDADGVAPLHRAVRTRCAAAVAALLAGGADARLVSGRGSTAMELATKATGRGGSGSTAAKAEQAEIVRLLEDALRR
jgi:ankyrin repeat protein